MTVANHIYRVVLLSLAVTLCCAMLNASNAYAAPVKFLLATQFGREVNLTTKGSGVELENICTAASGDECQLGQVGFEPGGFQFDEGAAGTASGTVYVADAGNSRIQEFTASGQFVLMFGAEVNETTKGNLCTAVEIAKTGVKCKAGVEGTAPGQIGHPYSVAVEPASGDIYLAEQVGAGQRVQKFTAEGRFLLEIGREVNETTKGNLCTAEEEGKGVKCVAPAGREFGSSTPGSFSFEESGDLLAVGPSGTLYAGGEGRVQEFKAGGEFIRELPVEAGARDVYALAVDPAGDLFLVTESGGSTSNVVHEFNAEDKEIQSITVSPEQAGAEARVHSLALDPQGHLVAASEQQSGLAINWIGAVYDASSGRLLSRFVFPTGRIVKGFGFNGTGELYVATGSNQEVLAYEPRTIAELATGSFACSTGAERETDATVDCALHGEVNPESVAKTQALFEGGKQASGGCVFGPLTAKEELAPVSETLSVSATAEGLHPNEKYCYRLAVEDANAVGAEALAGTSFSFTTEMAAPRIPREPEVQFVKPSSTVMLSELNGEKGKTRYFFEYAGGREALAKCVSKQEECFVVIIYAVCPGANSTGVELTETYGLIGVSFEVSGLQPATQYSYRLVAENENIAKTEKCITTGREGTFTTAEEPVPTVQTGSCSAFSATSAIMSGLVVPDGASVTYAFEIGVYEGEATRYGVVASGAVEPYGGPVQPSYVITGLQPGTTYACRISIASGYISNETHTLLGQPALFKTNGLTAVIAPPSVLAQLPIPIKFPKAAGAPKGKPKKHKLKKKQKPKAKGRKRTRSKSKRKH